MQGTFPLLEVGLGVPCWDWCTPKQWGRVWAEAVMPQRWVEPPEKRTAHSPCDGGCHTLGLCPQSLRDLCGKMRAPLAALGAGQEGIDLR